MTAVELRADRAWIHEANGPRWVDDVLVRCEGPRIAEVVSGAGPRGRAPGVVDLGACVLAPAWVNAHTHLPMSALRALGGTAARQGNVIEELWFKIEAQLTAADVRAFTRVGALECLLGGTGAVFEHYYYGEAVADALMDVGLTGVVAPTLQDLSGPGVPWLEQQLDATLVIHRDPARAEAGVVAALGPHATDTVSEALWRRALGASPDDLPVHVHVAQSPEEVSRLRARGCTPVEALDRVGALERRALLVHALYVTDADRRRLRPADHLLGHGPWSQTQFGFPAPLAPWIDAGFGIAVGTDAGACNDSMNVQQELRLLAAGPLYAVTDAAERGPLDGIPALRAERYRRAERLASASWLLGTVGSVPGSFHPGLPVGRIAAGAWANLAAWDLDHPAMWPATDPLRALCFADAGPALHSLLVSGRWIGAVGDVRAAVRSSDAREMIREASGRLASLLGRIG